MVAGRCTVQPLTLWKIPPGLPSHSIVSWRRHSRRRPMLKRHFLVGFVPFVLTSLKAFAQAPVTKENPVPKVVIIATIEVVPGRMNEYLPLILAHRARCLKDEPGTLALEVLRPQDEDNKVIVYEI